MTGRWKSGRVGLFVVLCLSVELARLQGQAQSWLSLCHSVWTRVALDMKLASGL